VYISSSTVNISDELQHHHYLVFNNGVFVTTFSIATTAGFSDD
jgi:hypothetical protein